MDHILLCSNQIPRVTSIHNTFIENYMLEANGSYVKVYLYLAKCIQHGEQGLSICSLADRMDNTEKDVLRALQYWEKKHLLRINRDIHTGEIIGIEMLNPAEPKESRVQSEETAATDITPTAPLSGSMTETAAPQTEPVKVPQKTAETEPIRNTVVSKREGQREISVSPQQLKNLAADESFVWICHVIESYLDRPLKANETRLLTYLYGTLHFSRELLLYLYEYCISLGKTNCNYIQSVALSWDEQGIKTPDEAEAAAIRYNEAYRSVSKALALGRALADIEKKYVDRWQNSWSMDLGVILEACNRTILKCHGADFKYTEGILDKWKQAGVRTLQDVEKSDQAYAQTKAKKNVSAKTTQPLRSKNQFQNFQQRGASAQEVDDLERKLLMR